MFDHLQIYDSRERVLVGCADVMLNAYRGGFAVGGRGQARAHRDGFWCSASSASAISDDSWRPRGRARPSARREDSSGCRELERGDRLGSCRQSTRIETMDVPWLVRHGAGASMRRLVGQAWSWRARAFDVALNFEPDIRSNLLLGLSGAPSRVGFSSAGGGASSHHWAGL